MNRLSSLIRDIPVVFLSRLYDIRPFLSFCKTLFFFFLILFFNFLPLMSIPFGSELLQKYEIQMSGSAGNTPLWLNANKYGLSSLSSFNGYVRGCIERPINVDKEKKWGIGYGLDLVVPLHYTSDFVIQQCYAEVRYKHCVLTLGQKEQPMQLKNMELSSGSQTSGINARPIPGVRLSFPEYWCIPGLHSWLAIKGHFSYGWMTDGHFQKEWTKGKGRYCEGVLYHDKAGYLRIGPGEKAFPLSLELGLEMACEFGGKIYRHGRSTLYGHTGLKAYIESFTAGGDDESGNVVYSNVAGDQLGSWVARLNYDSEKIGISLYADHYFEDHSSMFLLDYDGYGSGNEWDTWVKNRYLLYPLKDIMVGAELKLKHFKWIEGAVIEFMNTRYQSGPIYHDHTLNMSDHLGGMDSYYNHGQYPGWMHWGQVMGNPLYRSPINNTDGTLTVKDNRFYAWHFGMSGNLLSNFRYRVLCSWQKGWGTYSSPYLYPQENLSMMGEMTYRFHDHYSIRVAAGFDRGELLGNNLGVQMTFIYKTR